MLDWRNLVVLDENAEPDMFLMDTLDKNHLQGPVLDLGCGNFRASLPLVVRHNLVGLTGVDGNRWLIEDLQKDPIVAQLGIQCIHASLPEYDIGIEKWGVIICTQTLFLLPKRKAVMVLEQIKQGLKSGGIFYLETFHRDDNRFASMYPAKDEVDTFFYESPCGHHGVVCGFTHEEIVTMFLKDNCVLVAQDDGSYDQAQNNDGPKHLVKLILQKN